MKLILHDVVCSLSSALDLVGVTEVHHGKRVALMAANVAQTLGWDVNVQLDLLYAGMLHDCGVSTTGEHEKLVAELDWQNSQEHCVRGSEYLLQCPLLQQYAPWIYYHHTHWEHLAHTDLRKFDQLVANLLFLVDRVDFLQANLVGFDKYDTILLKKQEVIAAINQYAGNLFAPELIAAFNQTAQKESFWLAMDPYYVNLSVQNYSELCPLIRLNFEQIRSIVALFSKVIDAKSPFTEKHSKSVAQLARFLAEKLAFKPHELEEIEIAGMLHDLGKLRVPDAILNKQGPLTPEERTFIIRHSFDTVQLLKNIFPKTKIAQWAGFHHENLNGSGYPFHLHSEQLDLGARIIAVADVFQALVQNRPYRGTLGIAEIMPIIESMLSAGKLDRGVVEVLQAHIDACYALAQCA